METERKQITRNERNMTLSDIRELATVFIKSGLFDDCKSEAQAMVKIIAGRELGFPAMASMMGVNIVFGKTALSADLMAALVKRDRRYNFRTITHTANECVIEFYEDGKLCHTSKYTIEDATRAGLMGKDIWRRYPRNMLYARAINEGAGVVCPERVSGLYIAEDLSAPAETHELMTEAEAGKVTEELFGTQPAPATTPTQSQPTSTQPAEQKPAAPQPAPEPTSSPAQPQPRAEQSQQHQPQPAGSTTATTASTSFTNGHPRPMTAEQLKERFAAVAAKAKTDPVADGYRGIVSAALGLCFAGQADSTPKTHSLVKFLTGRDSRKDLSPQELRACWLWLQIKKDSGGALKIDSVAVHEAQAVITQVMRDAGQGELAVDEGAEPPHESAADGEMPF
jgi:hypothetical protein